MEIAVLILALGLFIFLFYMFSRVISALKVSLYEIKDILKVMDKKLTKMEKILDKQYRPYGRRF